MWWCRFWLYAFGFAVYIMSLQRCGSGQAPLYSEDTTRASWLIRHGHIWAEQSLCDIERKPLDSQTNELQQQSKRLKRELDTYLINSMNKDKEAVFLGKHWLCSISEQTERYHIQIDKDVLCSNYMSSNPKTHEGRHQWLGNVLKWIL